MVYMHWLVDGYNVIRREPDLAERERESLEAGRKALCRLVSSVARVSRDRFTIVFDGDRGGGSSAAGPGVRVIFSSARETADQVLARLAQEGTAVVSNDREVRQAATRSRAVAITTDEFLSRLRKGGPDQGSGKDDHEAVRPRSKKGNPRRLSKKDRLKARALGRLGS
jgi:predicted RNA-binding protein with PIN domain